LKRLFGELSKVASARSIVPQAWIDRGDSYFEQKKADRGMRPLLRRAQAMGMQLVPAATVSH
jgi:hypothetical protein